MFMVSILFLPLIFFANIIRLFVADKSFNEKLSDKTVVHRLPCRGGSCKAFLSFQIPEDLNLKQYLNLYALAFRIFFTKHLAVTNIRFYFANNNKDMTGAGPYMPLAICFASGMRHQR